MCKVYISGPITGDPYYKDKFSGVEDKLEDLGFYVINPINAPEDLTYREYINRGLELLIEADMICMLPGSATSTGAMLEYRYAQAVKMPILKADWYPEEWIISGYKGVNP